MTRIIHYDHGALWDVNICGVHGCRSASGDPKKVTCKRCRRHLTYWMKKEIAAQKGRLLRRRHHADQTLAR